MFSFLSGFRREQPDGRILKDIYTAIDANNLLGMFTLIRDHGINDPEIFKSIVAKLVKTNKLERLDFGKPIDFAINDQIVPFVDELIKAGVTLIGKEIGGTGSKIPYISYIARTNYPYSTASAIIDILLAHGVDINQLSYENRTALDYATQRNDRGLQDFLIERGARAADELGIRFVEHNAEEAAARHRIEITQNFGAALKSSACCESLLSELHSFDTEGTVLGFRCTYVGHPVSDASDDLFFIYGKDKNSETKIGEIQIVGGFLSPMRDARIKYLDLTDNSWKNFNYKTKTNVVGGRRKTISRRRKRNRNRSFRREIKR